MQTFKIKRYDYVTAAKAISLLMKSVQNFFYVLVEYNDVKAKYTEA